MAKASDKAATTEPEALSPEEEAAQVEEQQEQEALAAERRERGMERAADRKGYPDDAEEPPSQKQLKGGDTGYSHERLIEEAHAFTGHPPYVMAGALHGVDQPYLTRDEATKLCESFLAREV